MIIQVTRDNFDDLLPTIKCHIEQCDFVTIDTELTGLSSSKATQYNLFDSPQDRYSKVRSSAINFGLLQYGISCFTYNKSTSSFDTETYSFYLWPKVGTSADNGRQMLMQLSSIEFLVKWGFDFNLTFSKGVPFLSRADEQYRRNYLEKQQNEANSNEQADLDVNKLNNEDKQFLADHIEGIKRNLGQDYEVPPCNGFRRRLIHQEVSKNFPEVNGKVPLITKLSNDRLAAMSVSFVTPAEHEEHLTKNFRISMEALSQEVGFRHVIDHVIGTKKPVIGHNCFMDFCHTYQKFFEKLPESYEEFKKAFNKNFPVIFDSKYFAASLQEMLGAESTSLGDLYHFLSSHPIGKAACLPMTGSGSDGQEQFHDAGFDAYCTGQVFLGLCSIVGHRDNKSPYECMLDVLTNRPPYDLANRLFMMQSDCDGMFLAGDEEAPDRTAIVHVSNFDSSIKTSHVQSAFSDAGFSLDGRSIIWVDDQTIFVRLSSREDAIKAAKMKHIKMPVGKRATLMSYDQFISKDLPTKRKLSLSTINLS